MATYVTAGSGPPPKSPAFLIPGARIQVPRSGLAGLPRALGVSVRVGGFGTGLALRQRRHEVDVALVPGGRNQGLEQKFSGAMGDVVEGAQELVPLKDHKGCGVF